MAGKLSDKQYLKQGARISFKTITIGILSILEEEFGDLWGHGLPDDQLTDDQKYNLELWEETRERIINRGKESQNIFLDTLDKFSVRRLKHFSKGNFR